ncbi:hypothetical protein EHS39_33715 [Ensifer sp. MPMI2T]|nr:hypothetical protein EHS39_33715 [Ensifer sp. MPMI2T]
MPLIPLPRPSPRSDGEKEQAARAPLPSSRQRREGAKRAPRVPFAPLAGRRWPAGRMRGF